MKKIVLFGLLLVVLFGVYSSQESQSLSVLSIERVGDRLLSTEEQGLILQQSQTLSIPVDVALGDRLFGVLRRGHYDVIMSEEGVVYYHSRNPLTILAGNEDIWLVAEQTESGDRLLELAPKTSKVRVIHESDGKQFRPGFVWGKDLIFAATSVPQGNQIHRYRTATGSLEVFVENGYEPRLHDNRLYYLYNKGDLSGFESLNRQGDDRQSLTPAFGNIYSFFFRGAQVDLLTQTLQQGEPYYLRVQNAFGSSEAENFGFFAVKFQTERVVFGTNGFHDALLIDNTLVQIPKDFEFRQLIGDYIYYEYQGNHYRIRSLDFENCLLNK